MGAPSVATVRDYVTLLKPGVMSLVVFTAAVGMWIAPGSLHPVLQGMVLIAVALGSGAGGAINMWYDRDIDAIMRRTQNRPIPAGRIAADDALCFGLILAVLAVCLLGLATNWVAAGWLTFAIWFYAVFYTMILKRHTPQNIVIGGAAGALPPVIGWAAVTGSVLAWQPWWLFALTFFWTPPHFWALALYKSEDYRKAGIPMLPVVAGEAATKRAILVYTLVLAALALAPVAWAGVGMWYAVPALLLNAVFLWHAVRVYRSDNPRHALSMFLFSMLYLFALTALVCVDVLLG